MPTSAIASFRRSVIEEWSDEWDDSDVEVTRFEQSDRDEPTTYDVRGRHLTVDGLRKAAAWLVEMADQFDG